MKMRASASLLAHKKPPSPKIINNLNNEVCSWEDIIHYESGVIFLPRFHCKLCLIPMGHVRKMKRAANRNHLRFTMKSWEQPRWIWCSLSFSPASFLSSTLSIGLAFFTSSQRHPKVCVVGKNVQLSLWKMFRHVKI